MYGQVIDAIYHDGVLEPLREISLRESERVRLIIEREEHSSDSRRLALERLRAGIAQMDFFISGRLPSRDELHDRV
jgi:predicted DNA-binding antitoxin AbrB/MazE fold protein